MRIGYPAGGTGLSIINKTTIPPTLPRQTLSSITALIAQPPNTDIPVRADYQADEREGCDEFAAVCLTDVFQHFPMVALLI